MDWSLIIPSLLCLVLAGLLGAILGWLLGKATGGNNLKELEDGWNARLKSKEDELAAHQSRCRERTDALEADLKIARDKSGVHETTIDELHANADHLTSEVSIKAAELAAANTAVANAQSISQSDASEIARLRSAVAAAEADAAAKGKAHADLEARLQATNQKLSGKESELADTLTKLAAGAAIGSQLNDSTDKVHALESQLTDAGAAINFRDAEISKLRARLNELEASEAKLKDCVTNNHSQEAEIAALKSQLVTVQNQNTAEITTLKAELVATRTQHETELSTLKSQQLTAPQAPIESDLIRIQGVGKNYFEKMRSIGVPTQAELIRQGNTKKGREELAAKSGLDERLILIWVNHVDLIRINGVDEQFAELLEVAGVDTVPELATRNADNLHAKLVEVNNAERKIALTTPSLLEVQSWIGHAKTLDRIVTH